MTSGSGSGAHGKRKPPRIIVKSVPCKPLDVDMQPIDAVRLVSAFGTAEPSFASWMLNGIINAACDGGPAHPPGAEAINDALAAVTGIGARDETEGMLATQMVATHFAAISALRRLKSSSTIPQQDSNGNLAVKLLRTFTLQIEALQRYRGKGQQKVTVEHVHVNAGGQAIVGVANASKGNCEVREQQTNALQEISHAPNPPLRCSNPDRQPLPIAARARKTPL